MVGNMFKKMGISLLLFWVGMNIALACDNPPNCPVWEGTGCEHCRSDKDVATGKNKKCAFEAPYAFGKCAQAVSASIEFRAWTVCKNYVVTRDTMWEEELQLPEDKRMDPMLLQEIAAELAERFGKGGRSLPDSIAQEITEDVIEMRKEYRERGLKQIKPNTPEIDKSGLPIDLDDKEENSGTDLQLHS